jgi:hypothetical protein
MTTAVSQLLFVLEGRSKAWISRATGIPSSTVSYVVAGKRRLPAVYTDEVRRMYRRETYRRLRASGMSANQANRFKWYSAPKVGYYIKQMNYKVRFLALGHMSDWYEPVYKNGRKLEGEEKLAEIERQVREGLRKSREPWETWEDY